jgi:predicted transglutaminase-like cysteine proteinase
MNTVARAPISWRLGAAIVAASVAMPATAQVAPAYASFSKTDAILGGAPSALAAIMAQQSRGVVPAAGPVSPPTPASRGPMFRTAVAQLTPAPIALDRPDVFGSVALSVSSTSLDQRWTRVSRGPIGARATAYASTVTKLSPLERLDAVNRYVNQRVAFVNDIRQYGVSDKWTAASETLRRGRGDCEDFAIAKLQILRRAGIAEEDLYLVVLRDAARRADHAVLVVRAEGRMLVLDNGTSRIFDSAAIADYRPILTFSGSRAWTHGYRREGPPVVLATVALSATTPVLQMASVSMPSETTGSTY